jgi:acyl-CoA synthetase (AMP-forming)/AMP-acid ligase II
MARSRDVYGPVESETDLRQGSTVASTHASVDWTNGFHLVVDALELNGVTTIYGVVGIPITDLARLAQSSGIRCIGFRHEEAAGNAAAIALDLLARAKRPLVILGKGAAYAQCDETIRAFHREATHSVSPDVDGQGAAPESQELRVRSARGTMTGLFDLLDGSLRSGPNDVAIATPDRRVVLSYSQLARAVENAAGQLRSLGVVAGDTVAILADNCIEFAIALLGIAGAGATAAPLNPHLAGPELAKILSIVHAKATVVPEHLRTPAAESVPGEALWSIGLRSDPGGAPLVLLSGRTSPTGTNRTSSAPGPVREEVALVMLTGGTTAAPKAVPLTHANLAASIGGICATYELDRRDATLLVMPLSHGHGLIAGLLATLASGGAAYVPSTGRFSAGRFWPEMIAASATWYTAVPTMHQILLERAPAEYPTDQPVPLRFVRSCSAAIAPRVAEAVESTFHAPLISAYGMTETTHQAASNPLPDRGPRKVSSVGVPTGVALRIATLEGRPAAPGATGEVQVKGPTVTAGYLDDPRANASAFVDGWFRTGDLGLLDDDGYLVLKGRIKELINRGGEKIFPADVDAVLLSDPKVLYAASFGVPDAKYGEEIHAAIVLQPGQSETSAELRDHCAHSLADFEIPKTFVFVSDLPRTAKGSVDRRKLAESFDGRTG